jgi:flagellar protein FliL
MADDDEYDDDESEDEDGDEQEDGDEDGDEDEEGEGEEGGGGSRKKLFIIIGIVVILLIGGAAGAYFAGLFDSSSSTEKSAGGEPESEGGEGVEVIYKEFPDILTNLNEGRRKKVGVRIKVVLELASEEESLRMDSIMPKVHDRIQVYIRAQKLEDLKGSAGIQRIREELLAMLNKAFAPTKIRDLYFKEMLVR